MPCCHADFALTENSDRAFTVGMPTFTFGAGCLAEAGDQARELGLSRIALFTDATLSDSAHVAAVLASLNAAGIGVTVYNEIVVEPTTASFQAAARFAVCRVLSSRISRARRHRAPARKPPASRSSI